MTEKSKYHMFSGEDESFFPSSVNINKDIPIAYKNAEPSEEVLKLFDQQYADLDSGKNSFLKGIYFFGPAGTGKTHQMYGLLRKFRTEKVEGKLINVPDWLVQLRLKFENTANNMGLSAEYWIEREIKYKDILFIDDLGVEKVTDWNSEILYRLINYRSENELTTYIASNLSLNELAKQRDDRLTSRIAGLCVVKEIGGKDRRLG